MPTERSDDDAKTSAVAAAVLGAALALGALALFGGRAAFSVSVGAAIAVSNLLMLRAIIRAIVRPPDELEEAEPEAGEGEAGPREQDPRAHTSAGKRGGAAWGVFAILKIFILFGGVWLLLTKHLVDPIPLVVGYGVLPLGISASALISSLRPRR